MVHCHFRPKELVHFLLICFPGFVVGGAGVLAFGIWPLAIWIAVIIGSINAIVTAIDHTSPISLVIYLSSVIVLIVLTFVSFFTGFKIRFLPFKLCPVIFITSAVLIILGGLL
jgi:hypothetical protein